VDAVCHIIFIAVETFRFLNGEGSELSSVKYVCLEDVLNCSYKKL
jgi:hypothetical protein